jgi:hypothetical protein
MNQAELDRVVARVTGDCLSTIRRLGFGRLMAVSPEPQRKPLLVDWDELDQRRASMFP